MEYPRSVSGRNIAKDPAGSNTKAGVTNYDDLYADILKWQKEKWIDYVTPQIYWEIGKKVADYKILADWWSHNSFGNAAVYRTGPLQNQSFSKRKIMAKR